MTAGEEADGEFLYHLFLADDRFPKFGFESGVSFAEFVDGGDVVRRELEI